ncbi:glycosyltransferase [Thermodesulfobacteriota bacterium]
MQTTEPNPLVSIVIPVYNGSDYLQEAIDSALAQTYQHVEVIVVNDGSNDNGQTETVAKSYGEQIRYFYKENGGVASALNLGIVKMKGDYFSWLSHDDVYFSNKIEEQIRFYKSINKKKVIIYSDYQLINGASQPIDNVHLNSVEPHKLVSALLLNRYINGCSLLIPKVCFSRGMIFNEKLLSVQDYDLWFRMLEYFDFIHINKPLIKSRQHSKQGSRRFRFVHKTESDRLFLKTIGRIASNPKENFVILPTSKYFLYLSFLYLKSGLVKSSAKAFLYVFKKK